MRAKFRCNEINGTDDKDSFGVKLSAVQSDDTMENQDFNKYTPNGDLDMYIDNPNAKGFFEINAEYYLDFTKVD